MSVSLILMMTHASHFDSELWSFNTHTKKCVILSEIFCSCDRCIQTEEGGELINTKTHLEHHLLRVSVEHVSHNDTCLIEWQILKIKSERKIKHSGLEKREIKTVAEKYNDFAVQVKSIAVL